MLQFAMRRVASRGNAIELPHSSGRVPDKRLTPETLGSSCKTSKAGKPLLPQDGGSVPDRLDVSRISAISKGNEPVLPHDAGIVPVTMQCFKHFGWTTCMLFNAYFQDLITCLTYAGASVTASRCTVILHGLCM